MSHKVIEIYNLGSIANGITFKILAFNIPAGTQPPARAPDRPSSTR
jgi:hypothetical protein